MMRRRLPFDLRYDRVMLLTLLGFAVLSLVVLYSASGKNLIAVASQASRYLIALGVMMAITQLRPETLMRYSPWFYGASLILLALVLVVGVVGKGAQRWLVLGPITLQPSELMKIALPMMVSWWLARESLPPRFVTLVVAVVLVVVPVALILKQPDLGTAILIMASGLLVIFLAGLSWKFIIAILAAAGAALPLAWSLMHDYQRQRVITFLNPESDPLGAGYHSIQSMIAVGSGGFFGKGWLDSSQAHLGYLPERTTDFVFAVFAEEFGFIGVALLLGMYLVVIYRGLFIAYYAQDTYSRLLAGSLTTTFFLYFFVNIGMVTGLLPVVGVPLPLVSHGGSSLVTLLSAFGILMSIQTHRRILQQ
jgi:rod shape determining protein RodA